MAGFEGKIQRLSGTRDILPDEYEKRQRVLKIIENTFKQFGYRGVSVPTIELVELHLRKSGESIRQHMYFFKDQGQNDICLRPEFTASVVRMYNNSLQNEPLPLKFYYIGSAFRHDRPQTGRYREFTQAGVELIGGRTPEFDAEIIALACKVMDALEIKNYKVVIGNIGIVFELLSQKMIEERAKNYIIESLETFSKIEASNKGEAVEKWIKDMKNGFKKIGISLEELPDEKIELLDIVKELPMEQIIKITTWVLQAIYGETWQRGSSYEIAKKMSAKIKRERQGKEIIEALEFISKLMSIDEDNPENALNKASCLIKLHNFNPKPIEDLRQIVSYLDCYDIDWNRVKIDFGFGRGLEYYTGMIFEIYVENEKLGISQKQVCGGGRYDTLIADLGSSKSVPSLGFSFGLERLVLCMEEEDIKPWQIDVFVAPIGNKEEFKAGLKAANWLRLQGLRVDIGLLGLSPRELTGMSKRLKSRYTIFIGGEELKNGFVTLKDMQTGKQEKCSLKEAGEIIAEHRA